MAAAMKTTTINCFLQPSDETSRLERPKDKNTGSQVLLILSLVANFIGLNVLPLSVLPPIRGILMLHWAPIIQYKIIEVQDKANFS